MNELHDLLDESEDLVSELGFVDRQALAEFMVGHILAANLPSRESVPMLAALEHAVLVDRLRATARAWCEEAGARGAELWTSTH